MKGHTILVIIYALIFGAFLYVLIKHETSPADITEDIQETEFDGGMDHQVSIYSRDPISYADYLDTYLQPRLYSSADI